MAPYKFYQPRSLQALASARISNLAVDLCLQIQRRLPESQHLIEAKKIHQYLLKIRPLLEDIFNTSLATVRTQPLGVRGEVMLTALLHPGMKTISYPSFDLVCNDENCFNWDLGLWETYLEQAPNLIELDLTGVTTELDDILKVVGSNCRKLEIISIDKNVVTSNGALHLVNIKSLRIINDRKLSYCVDKPFIGKIWWAKEQLSLSYNLKGMQFLVQHLPHLEKIPYYSMGQLLEDLKGMKSLSLTECVDGDINNNKLQVIVALCPKLTRLYLFGHFFLELDLSPLTKSSLEISSLELLNVNVGETICEFLIHKGIFITELYLCNIEIKDTDNITLLVGRHCPNVKTLHITILHPIANDFQNRCQTPVEESLFKNLLDFKLHIYQLCRIHSENSFSLDIIMLCLVGAKHLQSLSFFMPPNHATFESVFSNLLLLNPLAELKKLDLTNCTISSKQLIHYLFNLPHITCMNLNMSVTTKELNDHIKELKDLVVSNNLNLNLGSSELPPDGTRV